MREWNISLGIFFLIPLVLTGLLLMYNDDYDSSFSSNNINVQNDITGMAYAGYSDPIFTANYSSVSINDDAIFNTGYYSIDGDSWIPFTLSGNILSGSWLKDSVSANINLPSDKESYIIVYSCSRISSAWDCHGNKWQIYTLVNNSSIITSSNNKIGLYVTQEELAIWRERVANKGPYYDEWLRVKANAESFRSNTTKERHFGYTDAMAKENGSECVPRMYSKGDVEGLYNGDAIRDAAFVSLVLNDTSLRQLVIIELLEQIKEPGVNFSNDKKWCNEYENRILDRNPGFSNAEWASRIVLAYDYVRPYTSDADKVKIDKWVYEAGKFFQKNVDHNRYLAWDDREGEVLSSWGYVYHSACVSNLMKTHLDGPVICGIGGWYNNRMAHQLRLVALVGVQQNVSEWIHYAKLWTQEYTRYHIYPENGGFFEFNRGSLTTPDLGLAYSHQTLSDMLDVADVLARNGDTSLYTYERESKIINQSGMVSLKHGLDKMISYSEGDNKIYMDGGQRTNDYLIDGVANTTYSARDIWYAQYNIYYQDDYIKTAYTREIGPKNKLNATIISSPDFTWMGSGKLYPSKLFMFGQMEGKVWPYP